MQFNNLTKLSIIRKFLNTVKKQSKLFIFAVIIGLLVISCSFITFAISIISHPPTFNPGTKVTQERSVKDFDKIVLEEDGILNITQGETEGLKITGGENILKHIESKVENKVLKINSLTKSTKLDNRPPHPPTPHYFNQGVIFDLTVRNINEITSLNRNTVNATNIKTEKLNLVIDGNGIMNLNVDVQDLTTEIRGRGNVKIEGKATKQNISLNAVGQYESLNLKSSTGSVKVIGGGKALINISEEIKIDIIGPGEVKYLGNPKIIKNISGGGKIKQI